MVEKKTEVRKWEGPRIIDVHTHPYTKDGWRSIGKARLWLEEYLYRKKDVTTESVSAEMPTDDEWCQSFVDNGVAGMVCAWDSDITWASEARWTDTVDYTYMDRAGTYMPNTNDYVANLVKTHPDALIAGWGSVDPWKGVQALYEAERCIKELNLIGMKFQQAGMAFSPDEHKFYPLWDLCQDLGAPVCFHTGYTGMGGGAPGGMGIKLKYTMNVIPAVDDVAADFPRLKIICLHHAEGRDEDVCLVCRHKGNVYRELSGIWPRYLSGSHLMYELNRRLRHKMMFGSEYNLYPHDAVIQEHLEMEAKGEWRKGVVEALFWQNAINILGEELERVGVDLKEWRTSLPQV